MTFPVAKSARQVLDAGMSEDELLTAVTDALTLFGWRWTHARRSDRALTMGHAGVPDVIAARRGRVLFLELKSETGRLTPDQLAWQLEITASHTVGFHVVRPADLDDFLLRLR